MNLTNSIRMRLPIVWVQTEEPAKTIFSITASVASNKLYRLDAIDGVQLYDNKKERWLKVLVNDPMGGGLVVGTNFQDALNECLMNKGILIIENAHTRVEMIADLLISIDIKFREALKDDNIDKTAGQLILLSHESTIPPEISRFTQKVEDSLPDIDSLIRIEERISTATSIAGNLAKNSQDTTSSLATTIENRVNWNRSLAKPRDGSPIKKVAESGLGLSESEFTQASLEASVRVPRDQKADFVSKHKLKLLKDNGILEVRTPSIDIDSVGGMDQAKELLAKIKTVWDDPTLLEKFHVKPIRRIMMVGVPGVGKSLLCEVASKTLGLDLAKGGISNSMSKWVGESESNTRRMFATLKAMAPIVFWIDEFGRDMSGSASSSASDAGTTDRVHGEFLTGIQELPDNILLIAAANRISDLPPEMTRADRFDMIMFAGLPTENERRDIFKIHLKDNPLYDYDELARYTPFFTGAEIKALIERVTFDFVASEKRFPETREIITAAQQTKGLVWVNHRDAVLEMYERARREWEWASTEQLEESDDIFMAGKEKIISHPSAQVKARYGSQEKAPPKAAKWGQ